MNHKRIPILHYEETIKHQKDKLLAHMEGPMEERERILNEILEAMGGRHV